MTNTRMQVSASPVTRSQIDGVPAWILVTPETVPWAELPYGDELARRRARQSGAANEAFATDLPNRHATRTVQLTLSPQASAFERLGAARRALDLLGDLNPRELLVSVHGLPDPGPVYEALASAALARAVP